MEDKEDGGDRFLVHKIIDLHLDLHSLHFSRIFPNPPAQSITLSHQTFGVSPGIYVAKLAAEG